MSKEITARYLVESKVKKALLPELSSIGFRLQSLAEEMLEGKEPKNTEVNLKEIIDIGYQVRALADKLDR